MSACKDLLPIGRLYYEVRLENLQWYIPKQLLRLILFVEFRMPESEFIHIKPTKKRKNRALIRRDLSWTLAFVEFKKLGWLEAA